MLELSRISTLSGVKGTVLSDLNGGLLDAVGEPDGESIAAVAGFLASTLAEAGEELGLGTLHRMSFGGRTRAWLMVGGDGLLTVVSIEPAAALAAVERAVESFAQER